MGKESEPGERVILLLASLDDVIEPRLPLVSGADSYSASALENITN